MRTIKFRAKRIETGEWIYGNILNNRLGKPNIAYIDYGNCYVQYMVNPDTVGQFTGLHDKNGQEIYEGDIIKYTRTNMYVPNCKLHKKDIVSFHLIKWNEDNCAFVQEHYYNKQIIGFSNVNFHDDRATDNRIEVIGNIHDNHELLKQQEL